VEWGEELAFKLLVNIFSRFRLSIFFVGDKQKNTFTLTFGLQLFKVGTHINCKTSKGMPLPSIIVDGLTNPRE